MTFVVKALLILAISHLSLSSPGETGPMCDGYQCGDNEKCCYVNGQHWCSPLWQSCYGKTIDPLTDLFEECHSDPEKNDAHLGRIAGSTGLEKEVKQCVRYTGCCVHDASGCRNVCAQGGYSTYSWWPTFNRCCCDCGTTLC